MASSYIQHAARVGRGVGGRFLHSVWVFPAVLIVALCVLTAFRVSGSSVGVYDQLLGVTNLPNLVSGTPQAVRTDEWMVTTPLTLSQIKNHFAPTNPDVGMGEDVTAVADVPYSGWSTAFRPQNIVFFILPAAFAFAFKWWLIGCILMLAVYFFVLYIRPGHRWLAALMAIFVYWSPFVQWWYSSGTLLSIAYALALLVFALMTVRPTKSWRRRIALSIGLAYTSACFALLLYPPFQIPCALVGAAIFISIYFSRYHLRDITKSWAWLRLAGPVLAGLVIVGVFIMQHHETLRILAHTVYPGARLVPAGGTSPAMLLQWPLDYLLPGQHGAALGTNQSEASGFLLFGLLLIPYLAYVCIRRKKLEQLDPVMRNLFWALCAVAALFLLRMFLPVGDGLYKLLQLQSIPHSRLLIGLGLINAIMICIAFAMPTKPYKSWRSLLDRPALIVAGYTALITAASMAWFSRHYDLPTVGLKEYLALIVLVTLTVGMFAHRILSVRYIGLCLAIVFTLVCSFGVNPYYRGFGSLTESPLAKGIAAVSTKDPSGKWVVSDKLAFESLPTAQGAPTLSGAYLYPQLSLWKKYFPGHENEYNRYSHALFVVDDAQTTRSITLLQGDAFVVKLSSCDPMLKDLHVSFLLTVAENPSYTCFHSSREYVVNGTKIDILVRN